VKVLKFLRFLLGIAPEAADIVGDLWFGCAGDVQESRSVLVKVRAELLEKIQAAAFVQKESTACANRWTLGRIN
jgi:hypothetical protein